MYVVGNPRTKKELKGWISEGRDIKVFASGLGSVPENGKVYLEGPHYPRPHMWYAEGTMENGRLVALK